MVIISISIATAHQEEKDNQDKHKDCKAACVICAVIHKGVFHLNKNLLRNAVFHNMRTADTAAGSDNISKKNQTPFCVKATNIKGIIPITKGKTIANSVLHQRTVISTHSLVKSFIFFYMLQIPKKGIQV